LAQWRRLLLVERDDDMKRGSQESWRAPGWFVSPWNYLPKVVETFTAPSNVRIHDVTLRDGEQQAGVLFRKDDKVRIAEALAELGVHRIEAGMPAVSKDDEAAIRAIVDAKLGPEIFCFSRCMKDDVKRAADCGVSGVVIEIPCSRELVERAYRWPMEKAVELSVEATQTARDCGLYTVFFTIDATRSDIDWYLDLVETVARDGHMDALALVDTFGALSPHGAAYYTAIVKERIEKPLEIHFHNDFGLAVPNTIMSVLAGAEVIHSTVAGLGERSGNACIEETAAALLALYGIDVGIAYDKLVSVAELVLSLAGATISSNKPLIGPRAFDLESGISTEWYRNEWETHPTDIFPLLPGFVGHADPKILLGKKSGVANVLIRARSAGFDISKDVARDLVLLIKEKALELGRELTDDEFAEIVNDKSPAKA
jgi:isopropylmalate/homocitrate/citramalate synthase